MNISDRMIMMQQGVANGGRCIWVEAREDWRSGSLVADDYLWQKSSGTLLVSRAAKFNASAVIWLDFAIFTHAAALVRYRHSAKQGGTVRSQEISAVQGAVIAAIFAWTGRADGSMLKVKRRSIIITEGVVGLFRGSRHCAHFANASVLTERAFCYEDSSDERRPPSTTFNIAGKQIHGWAVCISCNIY